MNVIVNTTVISNFCAIGQLSLLRRLFASIHIAMEVYEELMAGLEEGYDFYRELTDCFAPFSMDGWIAVTSFQSDQEIKTFGALPNRLHKGEAASLAIANHRQWVFLTDDRAARSVSKQFGIPISGSIGCLAACVERGLAEVDQANDWLRQMIELGFRSPITDLRELVKPPIQS